MNVIMSVKPKYCKEIKNGNKRYEFRKKIFKHYDEIKMVFIYATSPIKKIIGVFTFDTIIQDTPEKLWERCRSFAGIEKEKFFKYFGSNRKGYAIVIKNVTFFEPIDPKSLLTNFSAPQTYSYIEGKIMLLKLIEKTRLIEKKITYSDYTSKKRIIIPEYRSKQHSGKAEKRETKRP